MGCISVREGRTRMQQTAAESALFAPQTGLAFYMWLFLGGVTRTYVCTGQVFLTERNTFEARAAHQGMIRGVIIKLPHMTV